MFSFVLFVIAGHIYLRYATVLYQSKASIIIKDNNETSLAGELAPFSQLGIFNRYNRGKLENEIALLRSRRLLSQVIEVLDLNTKYEVEGRVISLELYPVRPFKISYSFPKSDSPNEFQIPSFRLNLLSDTSFEVELGDEIIGTYGFEEPFIIREVEIKLSKTPSFEADKDVGRTFSISYINTEKLAIGYQNALVIENDIDNSNIVDIKLVSNVPKKAEDFIDELILQYNLDAAKDQSTIAFNTAEFIDQRLKIIAGDLDSVELSKQEFKTENRLTDIEAESALVLQTATEFSNEQVDYSTRIQVIDYLLDYLSKSDNDQLLPANLGLEGSDVNTLIADYNKLILERKRLSANSTTENPIIQNIGRQVQGLRGSIIESLQNQRNSIQLALSELSKQEGRFNKRLSKVPAQERIFRDILRQQEIKEQLYLFLLKQREEASLKLASTTDKAKTIDSAYTSKQPVTPNNKFTYGVAGFLGLFFPFVFIYFRTLFNSKIENRKDVEQELNALSLIGEIPIIKNSDNQFIKKNDRSVLAESFRILRTNLEYLFINKNNEKDSHAIFVTSTIKGEGKTLIAFNLALTISYTGKRVVLVGADIRNPQLQRYLPTGVKNSTGLTEYIIDGQLELKNIIAHSEFDNLDIVLSGTIPPNPAELLMSNRVSKLFDELRNNYDYIIVDTAPSMLVTDTLLINKYADIILYTIKANYTDKKLLEFPKEAIADGRLSNIALVLNAVKMNNFGYGNKYGYAYSREKPTWKQRFFSRF